jgi:hypothetical protein
MIFTDILSEKNKIVLEDLLERCNNAKIIDLPSIKILAEDAARATNANKSLPQQLDAILQQWYNSLSTGTPDYSVYGVDEYIAELWACWKVYSRTHLRNIQKTKSLITHSIASVHANDKVIVDLGCGFAYTTATIKQIFPNSAVYGTNLDGTLQMKVARVMATDYSFTMKNDPSEIDDEVDLAFASEYFEHFDKPLDHLEYVVNTINPKAMLIANAFGPTAIGHFREYDIKQEDGIYTKIDAKTTGKLFNKKMSTLGYTKVKTKLWNNRPAYWVKKPVENS